MCSGVCYGMLDLCSELPVELHYRFDTFAEDVEAEVFVGRVDGVALQTKAHQHRLYAQYPLKVADDGMLPPRRTASGLRPNALVKPFSAAWYAGRVMGHT